MRKWSRLRGSAAGSRCGRLREIVPAEQLGNWLAGHHRHEIVGRTHAGGLESEEPLGNLIFQVEVDMFREMRGEGAGIAARNVAADVLLELKPLYPKDCVGEGPVCTPAKGIKPSRKRLVASGAVA
jgi:hypothetical protein